jgi:hypothetical protein
MKRVVVLGETGRRTGVIQNAMLPFLAAVPLRDGRKMVKNIQISCLLIGYDNVQHDELRFSLWKDNYLLQWRRQQGIQAS